MRNLLAVIVVAMPVVVSFGGCEKKAPTRTTTKKTQRLRRPHTPPDMPVPLALTLETLQNTPDDRLESVIIDAAINAIGGLYDWEYEVVQAWPIGLRMLYTTWEVEAEVNNGGFDQYFWNTEGMFSQMALKNFRLVGAKQYASLLERAIAVEKEVAAIMKKHEDEGTLDAYLESQQDSRWDTLGSEFYSLKEDLSALRVKYIRSHLDEFIVH